MSLHHNHTGLKDDKQGLKPISSGSANPAICLFSDIASGLTSHGAGISLNTSFENRFKRIRDRLVLATFGTRRKYGAAIRGPVGNIRDLS